MDNPIDPFISVCHAERRVASKSNRHRHVAEQCRSSQCINEVAFDPGGPYMLRVMPISGKWDYDIFGGGSGIWPF